MELRVVMAPSGTPNTMPRWHITADDRIICTCLTADNARLIHRALTLTAQSAVNFVANVIVHNGMTLLDAPDGHYRVERIP